MIIIVIIMIIIVSIMIIIVIIIIIITHCTHYQHSDWPRAPCFFENSRNFVDKHDYSIISYPIISTDYTAHSAYV